MFPKVHHLLLAILISSCSGNYWSERQSILSQEASELPGSGFQPYENEQKVNDILLKLKTREYDKGFADPSKFLPSQHFFKSKKAIEKSEVFKFIQKVPKGASLHSHFTAMLSTEALLNLTYMEGLYGCYNNNTFQLHFFFGSVDDRCEWKLLSEFRNEDPEFDNFLKTKLTLVVDVDEPQDTYPNVNKVWTTFQNIFLLISPLFKYRHFIHDYLYQVMQEFHDDNVMYLEIRAGIGETFDETGKIYNANETLQLYLDTMLEFRQNNIDFVGFMVIYAQYRQLSKQTMEEHIAQFLQLQNYRPDFIAGFDLTGQEDLGRPLSDFVDQLLEISNLTKFYFHAGETNWYGSTDLNLVDAILLNSSRIGHGFANTKHPELLKIVKERNIPIELNPISNQVLKLVDDLRNHPGATLIANGFPVVVTCDDPSFWGAKGLSYDWYMTFMAMTPRNGGLSILKQLSWNSIAYSSLSEKNKVYLRFEDIKSGDYWSDRQSILFQEASELPGSGFKLNKNEQKVNDILLKLKIRKYDEGFADPSKFLPSQHFFKSKKAIEKSEVFKFIQKVPKGASLHSHSEAMLSTEAFLNLTYMEGLYGCYNNNTFQLHFFFGSVDDRCKWKLLSKFRNEDSNFENFLRSKLTLVVDDPQDTYPNINKVWTTFENIFQLISPLFHYRQFLHDYLYQVMQEFYDDNVMHLEIRAGILETFDKTGKIYNANETLQLYLDTMLEFRQNNSDFVGFLVIYAKSGKVSNQTMEKHIAKFLQLQNYRPDFITGFDLVGQEDLRRPLSDFVDQLQQISNLTKFYFHAGETNWYGSTDLNLVDAILLNASRIGHGFAIIKHPELLKIAKERNIAIELNPISNQVLKLVDDLRNHPGATLIANGFPVVVTCDDPSFWGAKGLSYDWYMTFMAMTPRDGGLSILKQLAWNSITYSSLSEKNKSDALKILEGKWDDFLHAVIETYK